MYHQVEEFNARFYIILGVNYRTLYLPSGDEYPAYATPRCDQAHKVFVYYVRILKMLRWGSCGASQLISLL